MRHRALLFLQVVVSLFGGATALWPRPQNMTSGSTVLIISSSFNITTSGISSVPQDLLDAMSRTESAIANEKIERLVVGRGGGDAMPLSQAKELKSLVLSLEDVKGDIRGISEEAVDAIENRVEGYTLDIPDDGSAATLKAKSVLGLYRGLTTFQQLWYCWDETYYDAWQAPMNTSDLAPYTKYTVKAPMHIVDLPAYPYRGLMLDTARNFFPVQDIKRTLDAMTLVKMNVFHWHVVDSQSFPLQVPGFLELAEKGAYSSSSVYTQQDVKDVVSYAAARGIDVIAEIDTPGHTTAIGNAYPEHIACNAKSPWENYGNGPPAGQLRLASPATVNFTASLIEAASSLFSSKFFSTGGDEVNQRCYDDDPETQQSLRASGETLEQALDGFVTATHDALHKQGKSAVVWQEMALDHKIGLRNDTVVFVWMSSTDAKAVAETGLRFVHAASDYFYLDCGAGDSTSGGNSWCDPFKTWQKSYSFNPTANLTQSEAKLVLGGEHLLWTEQSGPQNLDSIVWPRAASGAELFWSGPGGNVSEALPRLNEIGFRMNHRGVAAINLQPLYCVLRPGVCDLTA